MDHSTLLGSIGCAALPLLTVCYLTLCWIAPFRRCRACGGTGLIRRRFGRTFRTCRRCDATGLRLRYGTHLINEALRIHRDGNR
ncbi:hypothetical protein Asi02nite_76560 [Asanoa siamensis]|uniref:Uncharacterized protein n=1 Tax=Asanoa siamensis TaxID=926357 RepID=A0ABQ4D3N2_9ACTN|nr:hypothetical protein Asi02nite_76560 [Asanoa siamensis]